MGGMLLKVEQMANSTEKQTEQLVDQKMKLLEDFVKENTAQFEQAVDSKWRLVEDDLNKTINEGEKEFITTIKKCAKLVKMYALPAIACEFTIVFWTTLNVCLAFLS